MKYRTGTKLFQIGFQQNRISNCLTIRGFSILCLLFLSLLLNACAPGDSGGRSPDKTSAPHGKQSGKSGKNDGGDSTKSAPLDEQFGDTSNTGRDSEKPSTSRGHDSDQAKTPHVDQSGHTNHQRAPRDYQSRFENNRGGGGGTSDGGGGQGVQCGETKNPKLRNRLFVRDIYEAINNHDRKMKTISENATGTGAVSREAIIILTESIKSYFGPASNKFSFTKEEFWTEFYNRVSFIDEDKELFPSQDANSPIALPKGCEIVQLAYWDESSGSSESGTLYINKKLWTDLDQFNKIGLLAHEFFFKQARKALYKNSDTVRFKVGQLLSEEGIASPFKEWAPAAKPEIESVLPASMDGYKFCNGTSADDPTANIYFYQYQGKDKEQHFVIPLLESKSINTSYFQASNFSFDPAENDDLAQTTDLLIYQSDFYLEGRSHNPSDSDDEWFYRWYYDTGLLSEKTNMGYRRDFEAALNEMTQKKEVMWSNYLAGSLHPIKVELLNPTYGQTSKSTKEIKSKKQVVAAINVSLKNDLKRCDFDLDTEIDGAIALLNKEVKEAVAAGIHPKNFTKWIETLRQKDCKPDESLFTDLPNLLYNVFLNNYNLKNIENELGDDAFNTLEVKTLARGRLKVSQGSNIVNFDLTCQDYATVNFRISKSKLSDNHELEEQKEVLVKLWKKNRKEPETDVKKLEKEKVKQELTDGQVRRFAEFLRFNYETSVNNLYYGAISTTRPSRCQRAGSFAEFPCKDFKSFLSELKVERTITVSSCPYEYSENGDSGLFKSITSCSFVEMGRTNNTYLIYYDLLVGDSMVAQYPHINFIRMIPRPLN